MLEIIALIFITKHIGKLAIQKGLKPVTWKAYTIVCWIVFEFIGVTAGVALLHQSDIVALLLLGLVCAFGGFLLIRSILQNKPDSTPDDDINRIGVDDLKP